MFNSFLLTSEVFKAFGHKPLTKVFETGCGLLDFFEGGNVGGVRQREWLLLEQREGVLDGCWQQ